MEAWGDEDSVMSREYGRKQSKPGFVLGAGLRYLITGCAVVLAFLIPKVVHDHLLVGLAECGLWLGFIAWVMITGRQAR